MSLEYYHKLEVEGRDGNFIDITDTLVGGVVYEDNAFLTDQLVFEIGKSALVLGNMISRGSKVRYTAGYNEPSKYSLLFEGIIAIKKPILPNNGVPRLKIQAYDYSYLMTLKKPGNISYPCEKCNVRPTAEEVEMKASDIIAAILKEYPDIKYSKETLRIPDYLDKTFTLKSPMVQKEDESDWDFIRRICQGDKSKGRKGLANLMEDVQDNGIGCIAWVELMDGKPTFFVTSEAEAKRETGKIKFYYQMVGMPVIKKFDPTREDAELYMMDVDIMDDPLQSDEKPKVIIKTSPDGKTKTVITYNDEGEIEKSVDYELDEELLRADVEAGLISEEQVTIGQHDSFERVKKYWKPIETKYPPSMAKTAPEIPEGDGEIEKELDKIGVLGQELSCKTKGCIHLYGKRSYEIFNVGAEYEGWWFLEEVTHTFDKTYECSLKFRR